MSVGDGTALLHNAFKKFHERWDDTRDAWSDAARERFEKEHLEPVAAEVKQALTALGMLEEMVTRMRRDCIDR